MAFAPDGRLFVCSQDGDLRVIKNGVLLPTPFVNLNVDSHGERGLLGVAFDPDFATNQFVYIYHTVPGTTPRNRVSRFTADGDVALAGSRQIILSLATARPPTTTAGRSTSVPTASCTWRWAKTPTPRTRRASAIGSARCCA